MKKKQGKFLGAFITTGAASIINYGITLVLTSYVSTNMSENSYGFVSLAKNLAQYASLLTIALNIYATRYIAMAYHNGDYEEANMYRTSVFFGDLGLSAFVLILISALLPIVHKLLNVPAELLPDVRKLFFIVFFNFCLTTTFSVFNASAMLESKLEIVGVVKGISYFVEACVLIFLFSFFRPNIYFVGLGLLAASVLVCLTDYLISRKYTPQLKIKIRDFSFKAVKTLVFNGIWAAFNQIGNLLNSGLDLLICNLMLAPIALDQLAIAKTMEALFYNLFQISAQVFQPMFLKSYAAGDIKTLLKELKLSMKVSGLLANAAFAGFIAIGHAFLKLWTPSQDIDLVFSLVIVSLLPLIFSGPITPLYYVYTLTIKQKVPCIVTFAGGMANVVSMYFLIKYTNLGVLSVVWTTAVIVIIRSVIIQPLYMAHCLKMPWHTFYPSLIRHTISCVIQVLCLSAMAAKIVPSSWLQFILCLPLFGGVAAVIHLLIVCDPEDWRSAIAKVRTKLAK